jgi:NTP pyrophosphatase (non-canonical NTP hydrolase)
MNKNQLEYVRAEMPADELLTQLAEEAAELAQAALKLRRTITTLNPTPTTAERALDNLREEVADVCLLFKVMQIDTDNTEHKAAMAYKLRRWVERIEHRKNRAKGAD